MNIQTKVRHLQINQSDRHWEWGNKGATKGF